MTDFTAGEATLYMGLGPQLRSGSLVSSATEAACGAVMSNWTPDSDIDLRARHPNYREFLDHNEAASERIRSVLRCSLDVAYDMHPLQRADLFPAASVDAPALVFIHGGYWRALDKRSYAFVAKPFVDAGYAAVVLNYRLMPAVRMTDVIADIQQALRAVLTGGFRPEGIHPRRLGIAGHSAGGHLAITAPQLAPDVHEALCGIASISGLFDLASIQRSRLNETLALSDEEVRRFSPLTRALPDVPVHAGVGGNETLLYLEETAQLANAAGVTPTRYDGLNHYQAVHLLGACDGLPTRFLLSALAS